MSSRRTGWWNRRSSMTGGSSWISEAGSLLTPSYERFWTRTPQAATGASTPSSSKTRRPLHNRAQPCSQWSATTAAARASWLSALGQVVSWLHVMAITSTHSALLPLQRHRLARGDDGYADQVSGRSLLFRS